MTKERNRSIDFMKTLLVWEMVSAHVFQFFAEMKDNQIVSTFSTYINSITFSGFLFCFGYAVGIAYMGKRKNEVIHKFVKNTIRMLLAFYISGITYNFLVVRETMNIQALVKVLLLWNIPGYSEFLASFAILNILTCIFFNQIKRILKCNHLIMVILLALVLTFFPYNIVKVNQLGLIIGTTKYPSFPIIQYSPFYLIGIYFQQNRIWFKLEYLFISLLCSVSFIIYRIVFNKFPNRFPPSVFWILSAAFFIYIYYIFSIKISCIYNIPKSLTIPGENSLFFIVSSNIIIFTLKYLYGSVIFSPIKCIFITIIILIACSVIITGYKKLKISYIYQKY